METFDLGIAWDQELDNEFVEGLNNYSLKEGLRPYLLHGSNFYASLKDISEGNIHFRLFLNRASEDDPVFSGLPDFLKRKGITFINHPDNAKRSADKFQMHSMFVSYGLPVPKTVFLKSREERQVLEAKIQHVCVPCVLKSAFGSCSDSTAVTIDSLDDALRLMGQDEDRSYVAQEQVSPVNLENKPAWFKVLYCFGEIIACRWHPVAKEYDALTLRQIYRLGLHEVWPITKKIRQACKLDFFSTDIAMKEKGKFLIVDYVNDRPDMRKKSKFKDALPDEIVDKVINSIVSFVKKTNKKRWLTER
jgi:glutathione synthase/RimK-type ligase-like ATP-grasp enzyme